MRLNNLLSRRFVFAAPLAVSVLALVPRPVLALTEAAAKALVGSVVADINRIIDSGKSEAAMIRDFEKLFTRYADVPIMARYALGADVRRASSAQLRRFTKAFSSYVATKYGRRFREFIGGRVEVNSTRPIKNGYEVRSTAYLSGQSPFDVTFLVSDRSGQDKFYNMFIEGVNLLLTERSEIGAMIDKRGGNLDKMIADLEKLS